MALERDEKLTKEIQTNIKPKSCWEAESKVIQAKQVCGALFNI